MVRGKVQLKRIENVTTRQVTFTKRRSGLLKKAYELSVLCDAQVAVVIFSQKGRLYDFSSTPDIRQILERYRSYAKDVPPTNKCGEDERIQQLKVETENLAKKIELLEVSKRKLLGHSLSCCSYDELQGIENQLQTSLQSVRLRKAQLFDEHMQQVQSKERNLLTENAKLRAMCVEKPSQELWAEQSNTHTESGGEAHPEAAPHNPTSQSLGVETELFIGLPLQRC